MLRLCTLFLVVFIGANGFAVDYDNILNQKLLELDATINSDLQITRLDQICSILELLKIGLEGKVDISARLNILGVKLAVANIQVKLDGTLFESIANLLAGLQGLIKFLPSAGGPLWEIVDKVLLITLRLFAFVGLRCLADLLNPVFQVLSSVFHLVDKSGVVQMVFTLLEPIMCFVLSTTSNLIRNVGVTVNGIDGGNAIVSGRDGSITGGQMSAPFQNILKSLLPTLQSTINGVVSAVGPTLNTILSLVSLVANGLGKLVGPLLQGLLSGEGGMLGGLLSGEGGMLGGLLGGEGGLLLNGDDGLLGGLLGGEGGLLLNGDDGLLGGLPIGEGGLLNGAGGLVGGIVNIAGGVGGAVGGVAGLLAPLNAALFNIVKSVGSNAGNLGVGQAVGNNNGQVTGAVGNTIGQLGGASSGLGQTVGNVIDGVGHVVSGAGQTVGGLLSGLENTLNGAVNGAGQTVGNVIGGAGQAAGGLVSGLENTLNGAVSSAGQTLGHVVNTVGQIGGSSNVELKNGNGLLGPLLKILGGAKGGVSANGGVSTGSVVY